MAYNETPTLKGQAMKDQNALHMSMIRHDGITEMNNKLIASVLSNSRGNTEMSMEDIKLMLLTLNSTIASQHKLLVELYIDATEKADAKTPWYKKLFRK